MSSNKESTLTKEQKKLLESIPQELRRETALAYISSGYENKTQSYLTACKVMGRKPSKNPETSASEMLSYPNVIEFIDSFKISVAEEVRIDSKYVLRRLKEIDELDIIDIITDDMSCFKPLKDWPKSWRISISSVDMRRILSKDSNMNTIIEKIKWPDKVKNLEMIGRHVTVKAWDKEDSDQGDPQPLTINFEVSEAVKDIKITNADS